MAKEVTVQQSICLNGLAGIVEGQGKAQEQEQQGFKYYKKICESLEQHLH